MDQLVQILTQIDPNMLRALADAIEALGQGGAGMPAQEPVDINAMAAAPQGQ